MTRKTKRKRVSLSELEDFHDNERLIAQLDLDEIMHRISKRSPAGVS